MARGCSRSGMCKLLAALKSLTFGLLVDYGHDLLHELLGNMLDVSAALGCRYRVDEGRLRELSVGRSKSNLPAVADTFMDDGRLAVGGSFWTSADKGIVIASTAIHLLCSLGIHLDILFERLDFGRQVSAIEVNLDTVHSTSHCRTVSARCACQ